MFVVPVLFGMYWKKATTPAAWASIICGDLTLVLCTKVPALKEAIHGFHAVVPAFAAAVITMVVVSLITPGRVASEDTLKRHLLAG